MLEVGKKFERSIRIASHIKYCFLELYSLDTGNIFAVRLYTRSSVREFLVKDLSLRFPGS